MTSILSRGLEVQSLFVTNFVDELRGNNNRVAEVIVQAVWLIRKFGSSSLEQLLAMADEVLSLFG